MKSKLSLLVTLLVAGMTFATQAAEPLRVFIRGGEANRGQEIHAHPRFLAEWTKLLTARGMKVEGGTELPTADQLAKTDVLVMYAQDGGAFPEAQRPGFEAFLKRGGGLVVLHTATVPTKNIPDGSAYWKSIIGGSWVNGTTKWLEGPMSFYYVDRTHPISQGTANFDIDDEIYYDMDMDPRAQVLGAAYTPNTSQAKKNDQRGLPPKGKVTVYDIAPQMWTFENKRDGGQPYRAFVSIPGHQFKTFEHLAYRAVLLRGIAWVGKRSNLDEFAKPEELAALRYPAGGTPRPEQIPSTLVTHPEFKVSLVATEPLINKVMNIDWDGQGRLWVAETPEYPDGRSANAPSDYVQRWQGDDKLKADGVTYDRPAFDRISILTDTDGDGVMDKKQIFADFEHGVPGGLERASSFVFYKDGVIVSAAPVVWLLRDTNGDGVCDKAQLLYTNLGERDTHAVLNNLRNGFDGWIYGTHGYSSTPNVKSGDGSKDFGGVGSGVVRFKPDGSAFEQFSSKGGNTWGLQVSWDNEIFWTQPTSGDLLMHTVMNESLMAKTGMKGLTSFRVVRKSPKSFPLIPYDQLPYVQIDWVGSFTAAAGTVIYDGGAWPAKWQYSYFCTEPTINLVHQEFVKTDGVSYVAEKESGREDVEFIAGKNLWFRPIDVRTGPDGGMYVVDFCNQAIIHNDTRGPKHGPRNAAIRPDRDHYYGRIWRVDHKDAKKLPLPTLAKASSAELVKALENVNDNVRLNAVRLLAESGKADAAPALKQLVTSQKSPQARVAALWALHRIGQMDAATLTSASASGVSAVAKNAMMVAAENPGLKVAPAALRQANSSDPRVALEALKALAVEELSAAEIKGLVQETYPKLNDPYLKAAFMIVANRQPAAFLEASYGASNPEAIAPLVSALTTTLIGSGSVDDAAKLVVSLADKPASQDSLKQALLSALGSQSKGAPKWNGELEAALKKLLSSSNARLAAAALPLAVQWDTGKVLATEVKREIGELAGKLGDASLNEDAKAEVAATLIEVRTVSAEALPAVTKLLSGNSGSLQTRVVESLGAQIGPDIGTTLVSALPGMTIEGQGAAINQLLKRPVWSMALLDAMDSGKVPSALIGPANIYRLRTHNNPGVAKRANELIDKLRGPEAKEKAALIAKLAHEVEQKGNVAKGKELFTVNCATCHQLDNLGNNVGPNLTGMGAHGPAELLGHIIDPNREVDFSFVAVSVETKDGESYDGIVTRENPNMVALRNAQGEKEIAKKDIKSRRSTGRSLMPEGFEALGGEGLRDLLAFICADNARFRFIDLSEAFTANSKEGLYASRNTDGGMLPVAKYGVSSVFGVPFNVIDASKHPSGKNVMVLKGGPGGSLSKREMPQKVEAKLGFEAKQLYVLGNVGGWAHPFSGDNVPAFKITAHYAGGATQELIFTNGVEYADYIREVDVPGSKLARGIAADGKQVRVAARRLSGKGVVEKLTFESFNNGIAPTTLAVTADLSDETLPTLVAAAPAPTAPAVPVEPFKWGAGTKVLLVGGGSAHDFQRFFNLADTEMLKAAGYSVNYTEDGDVTARELANVDVAVLSVNRAVWATPALRTALFEFVNKGKGLILLHPGVWYNFKDWPEYNKELAGGGSRGHDKYGEFEVTVTNGQHPVMKGVPDSFKLADELYYFEPDAAGTPIEILATAHSNIKNKTYPQVFIVKHPKTRIVGFTLGHDAVAHSLPAYQTVLKNAINWTAGK